MNLILFSYNLGEIFKKKIIRKEKGWSDKDGKEISCTHGLWLRRGASYDLYARSHGHVIKVEGLTKYTVNVSNITVWFLLENWAHTCTVLGTVIWPWLARESLFSRNWKQIEIMSPPPFGWLGLHVIISRLQISVSLPKFVANFLSKART